MKRFAPILSIFALLAASLPGTASEANALVRTFQQDGVSLVLRAAPASVSDIEEVNVTLELTHPDGLEVRLPADFTDRFQGLSLLGSYEGEAVSAGGIHRRELHLHARPVPGSERLRIAPFPVQWNDPATGALRWFPTRAVTLERKSLLAPGETAPTDIEENLQPVRIRRSAKELLRYGLYGLGILVGLGLVALLARFLCHRVRVARMAPRERALHELQSLLDRHLAERGRFKEFYVELTHVVRRYIERRHGIRAPKQTTEEFLRAAVDSGRFPAPTLERLKAFLVSSDMVKFAGIQASTETAASATASARAYLEAEPKEDAAK